MSPVSITAIQFSKCATAFSHAGISLYHTSHILSRGFLIFLLPALFVVSLLLLTVSFSILPHCNRFVKTFFYFFQTFFQKLFPALPSSPQQMLFYHLFLRLSTPEIYQKRRSKMPRLLSIFSRCFYLPFHSVGSSSLIMYFLTTEKLFISRIRFVKLKKITKSRDKNV